MVNLKNSLSCFQQKIRNKIKNVKNKAQNAAQKFQKNFSEAKSKPRSKRRSLFLGFTTVLSIFGLTVLASVLPAVAKDLSKNGTTPGEVRPTPTQNPKPALVPSQEIVNGFYGAAATIWGLAVSSGPFIVGAVCGVIVVVGILKAQGK